MRAWRFPFVIVMMDSPQPSIYLDHAATTPLDTSVLAEMQPFFCERFANPSSIYAAASQAREAVEASRQRVADAIGASPEEIYFTSGGTEGDNWAIHGLARSRNRVGRHALVSSVEHRAVMEPCESLSEQGMEVEWLPVDSSGSVDPDCVRRKVRSDTAFVTVMFANNEVGTIQPVKEIGAICGERGVPFHTDAVQALGSIPIDAREVNAAAMTLSAHKIYGPKGTGALYVRRGERVSRFMLGGEQERGARAGTLNVPAIVGFGFAAEKAERIREAESARLSVLRDQLIAGIEDAVEGAHLCGSRVSRLANNAHFCFDGIEGESLLLALDMAGICASAGSACSAGSTEPSHVLRAMGISTELSRGSVRFSLGRSTTCCEVDYAVNAVTCAVEELRNLR